MPDRTARRALYPYYEKQKQNKIVPQKLMCYFGVIKALWPTIKAKPLTKMQHIWRTWRSKVRFGVSGISEIGDLGWGGGEWMYGGRRCRISLWSIGNRLISHRGICFRDETLCQQGYHRTIHPHGHGSTRSVLTHLVFSPPPIQSPSLKKQRKLSNWFQNTLALMLSPGSMFA